MSAEAAMLAGTPTVATVNAENPWPGLLAFRETDEGYFQGRKTETEDLLRLTLRERLAVLFGLSGLGKSSLLQAGLFPRLRQENVFPIYLRLDFSSAKPDLVAQVLAVIAREAKAHGIEAPQPKAGETLWEYFHRSDNNFWNARNRPMLPLLAFDQFEEVFTLGRLDSDRSAATDAFLKELADLAECRPPAKLKAWIDQHPDEAAAFNFGRHYYKVLVGIREDFLADLETLRTSMPSVALNRLRLRRMNGDAALLVVNQVQNLIDPDVGEKVVRFVAADKRDLALSELEVEPALLSVVCRELNNRRQQLKEPKISSALLQGSQEQILADFYERSTADLTPEARHFIEDHLITVSGFRDSVALENALNTPGISREAIDTLVERRLVRREDRGGSQRLELTHDLLAGVVRTSRDTRHQREAAEKERAALLETQEQERQLLLKAKEEERLALEKAQEQERRERDQKELRRSRRAMMFLSAFALVAMGMAFWAWHAQGEAKKAQLQAENDRQRALAATDSLLNSLSSRVLSENGRAPVAGAAAGPSVGPEPNVEGRLDAEAAKVKRKLSGDHAVPPPPPQEAQQAAVPRVFIQIVNQSDREYAKKLAAGLQPAGFSVQPIQYVPQAAVLSRTDIRYYRKSDQAEAQKILDLVKAAGQASARMYIPSGQENNPNVRPNTFEVWLANGAGGQ